MTGSAAAALPSRQEQVLNTTGHTGFIEE